MDLGLGLPISDPARLLDWAARAQAARFDSLALLDRLTFDNPEPLVALAVLSLALLDRLTFDNPEPLVALAVLAGATTGLRLQTEVLLGPLRATALLAKQAATLDRMSGSP
ncbi:flavin-dependent oxidoreductase, F420-dependent methylene-tetrahydromethanopterin reductase [Frankia sp. QA3]|nr:LLM class flavin-dependent oxidoreductase [Frankia sp. QA3]EIV92151.1 flavin-dependent oxidoreductase, F420-dependent methylene-tetrahydromethanopterin reductase [Frankia sp. QA3]